MASPLDHLSKIRQLCDQLNPSALQSKVKEYRRGDFRTTSIPDGAPSSETKILQFDKMDRTLRDGHKGYARSLQAALDELEAAMRFQTLVLVIPEHVPDPPVIPCANNDCPDILELGRKKGECVKCRVHRHRWSLTWPKLPADAEEGTG